MLPRCRLLRAFMLPAILTTLLWSCSAICAARSARLVGGAAANVARIMIAMVLLGVWSHAFGWGLGGPALPWFLVSGFVGFGLGDLAMFAALQRVGPRLTMLLTHCVAAPLAAGTEWIWLGTRLGWKEMACGAAILAGVALALAPDRGLSVSRSNFWVGVLCGIGSACGQGFGSVLSRKANLAAEAAGMSVDGGTAAYERIAAGLVVAVAFALVMRRTHPSAPPVPGAWRRAWGWIAANALAGPSVGVACYQWALTTTPTGLLMPVVATVPVVTQFVVWLLDGVRPTRRTLVGGIIAAGGVGALRYLTS